MGMIETEEKIEQELSTGQSDFTIGEPIYSAEGEVYRARMRELGIKLPDELPNLRFGEPLYPVDFKLYRKMLQEHASFSRKDAKAQVRRVRGEYIDGDKKKRISIERAMKHILSHFRKQDSPLFEPVPIEEHSY